jgi:hypothetical protein
VQEEWKHQIGSIVFIDGRNTKSRAPAKLPGLINDDVFLIIHRSQTTTASELEVQGRHLGMAFQSPTKENENDKSRFNHIQQNSQFNNIAQ